jgi:hypothetical protein
MIEPAECETQTRIMYEPQAQNDVRSSSQLQISDDTPISKDELLKKKLVFLCFGLLVALVCAAIISTNRAA